MTTIAYHTKPDKDNYQMIPLIGRTLKKKMIQMNSYTKQMHTKQLPKGRKEGWIGTLGLMLHITVYKIDNKQGTTTISHRELYSIFL